MNAPVTQIPSANIPTVLLRRQPPAKFSLSDDVNLTISVGDQSVTITAEDLRRLDCFMNKFSGGES